MKDSLGQDLYFLSKNSLQLHIFYDVDWARYPMTRYSTTDFFISLEDAPISWRAKKVDHCLICLTISRPDIVYSVYILTQFMQSLCQPHLDAVYRILHYLKGSPRQGLYFLSKNSL